MLMLKNENASLELNLFAWNEAWLGYDGIDLAQALDTSIVDQVASRTSTWQENGESKESMSF